MVSSNKSTILSIILSTAAMMGYDFKLSQYKPSTYEEQFT